jgi:hypothetical protein
LVELSERDGGEFGDRREIGGIEEVKVDVGGGVDVA